MVHEFAGGRDVLDRRDPLPRAPDIAPRLRLVVREIHLRFVRLGQRVGIEPTATHEGTNALSNDAVLAVRLLKSCEAQPRMSAHSFGTLRPAIALSCAV